MNLASEISTVCGALSHPKRVDIFLALLPNADDGVPSGELAATLGLPASTFSFHLQELEKGGVITRTMIGRQTIIRPSVGQLNAVLSRLARMCCPNSPNNPKESG